MGYMATTGGRMGGRERMHGRGVPGERPAGPRVGLSRGRDTSQRRGLSGTSTRLRRPPPAGWAHGPRWRHVSGFGAPSVMDGHIYRVAWTARVPRETAPVVETRGTAQRFGRTRERDWAGSIGRAGCSRDGRRLARLFSMGGSWGGPSRTSRGDQPGIDRGPPVYQSRESGQVECINAAVS
jgi:hypothetical protein